MNFNNFHKNIYSNALFRWVMNRFTGNQDYWKFKRMKDKYTCKSNEDTAQVYFNFLYYFLL